MDRRSSTIRFLPLLCSFLIAAACGDRQDNRIYSDSEVADYARQEIPSGYPEEMAEYREAFDAAALPFATAEGKVGRTTVFDSKFLGTPYMPKDFEYPRDPDGRPLGFLAQINFADVPPLPDYPDDGILQFYISGAMNHSNEVWGLEFLDRDPYDAEAQLELQQTQNYFRVVWHPNVLDDEQALTKKIPRGPQNHLPIDDEAKLTFSPGMSYPVPVDYRFEEIFGADGYEFFDRFEEVADVVAEQYWSHVTLQSIAWIGGYAYFTQDDPRHIAPDEDFLLLFEIQSSMTADQPSVLWGDVGIGAFFIRRDDLRNRDFSRVLYNWDNH